MASDELIIEEELAAQPISKTQMDMLWLDPSALDLIEKSINSGRRDLHMLPNSEGGLRELKVTLEDVAWAKQVNALAGKAAAASQRGDYPEAISLYRQALKLAPGCDQWLNSIGSCYALMGEPQKGLRYINRALAVSSQPLRIEKNLANLKGLTPRVEPSPANIEEAIHRISRVGGSKAWTFVWLFSDLESTVGVLKNLPYFKIIEGHVEVEPSAADYQKAIQDVIEGRQDAICIKITEGCVEPRSGTEGWIIHMPNYIHPDGTKGVYALVTGGIISMSEVSTVMALAKSAGSLAGSAIIKPKETIEDIEIL
jgi:tetratricopeptide (TPR) repeat protein